MIVPMMCILIGAVVFYRLMGKGEDALCKFLSLLVGMFVGVLAGIAVMGISAAVA